MVYSFKEFATRLKNFYYRHESLRYLEDMIAYTRRGKPLPMPKIIFVEPTNACNYRCPKCPHISGLKRPISYLDVDLFRDLVAQFKPYGSTISLHHSGESMLHPRIFDLIRISRSAGLHTIMVTNASLLDREDFRVAREGPDAITFSVDGASAAVYEPAHGGASWDKVSTNIGEFFKRLPPDAPTRHVLVTIVKNCQTPEQMEEFMNFTRRLPFTQVLVRPFFIWPEGKAVTPFPKPSPGHWAYPCTHPWFSPAVLADGSLVPCCLDAHRLYPVGNVGEKSFLELFRGEKFDILRRHLLDLDGTSPLTLCDSCGLKQSTVPFSSRGRILFRTMPAWKLFFRSG